MSAVRGFVKKVSVALDKENNPVVLVTIQTKDIENATALFACSEVTIEEAQGRLALADGEED